MNKDVMQGKWKQMSGDVKKFFGKLTDDDLAQAQGDQEKMVGRLQERYGYTREQAQAEWDKFNKQHGSTWNDMKNQAKDTAHDVRNAAKDAATDIKSNLKR